MKKATKIAVTLVLVAVLVIVVSSFLWEEREQAKAEVAIVFDTGGLAPNSFNDICLSGAKKAEEELGIKLDYVVAKTIQDFEGLQRKYAESGEYDIIICIGISQANALLNVATDFTEQKFALIDGTIGDRRQNVASFLFRDEESSFLAGALAAMVTTTNKIGFVGGMDIPVINRYLAGYRAGVEYINPDCEIMVSYVGSWTDAEKGKELALEQYDSGADIVFGAADVSGLGVIEAAKERGLYAIGVDTDQRHLAPENVLGSTLKSVDVVVFNVIKEATENDFKGGISSLGLKEKGVGFSINNALPIVNDEIKGEIAEIQAKINSREIEVPYELSW